MRSLKSRGGLTRGRGFEEDMRHLWVTSLSYTAAAHNAMTLLFGVYMGLTNQNTEKTNKRRVIDCEKFYDWFVTRNPLTMVDDNLYFSTFCQLVLFRSFRWEEDNQCESSCTFHKVSCRCLTRGKRSGLL